jgi:single-stranded DNA-binding protein
LCRLQEGAFLFKEEVMATNFIAIEGTCWQAKKKESKEGKEYIQFNLAHQAMGKTASGEWKPKMYFRCTAFSNCIKWFPELEDKVSVFVTGRFDSNTYKDKDGKERTGLNILVDSMQVLGPEADRRERKVAPSVSPAVPKKTQGDNEEDFPF